MTAGKIVCAVYSRFEATCNVDNNFSEKSAQGKIYRPTKYVRVSCHWQLSATKYKHREH